MPLNKDDSGHTPEDPEDENYIDDDAWDIPLPGTEWPDYR